MAEEEVPTHRDGCSQLRNCVSSETFSLFVELWFIARVSVCHKFLMLLPVVSFPDIFPIQLWDQQEQQFSGCSTATQTDPRAEVSRKKKSRAGQAERALLGGQRRPSWMRRWRWWRRGGGAGEGQVEEVGLSQLWGWCLWWITTAVIVFRKDKLRAGSDVDSDHDYSGDDEEEQDNSDSEGSDNGKCIEEDEEKVNKFNRTYKSPVSLRFTGICSPIGPLFRDMGVVEILWP